MSTAIHVSSPADVPAVLRVMCAVLPVRLSQVLPPKIDHFPNGHSMGSMNKGSKTTSVLALSFIPGTTTLLSGSMNGRICLWPDGVNPKPRDLQQPPRGYLLGLVSNMLGSQMIVSTSKALFRYEIDQHGLTVIPLKLQSSHHQYILRSVVMLSDNQRAISASEDKSISLWDYIGPKVSWTVTHHDTRVYSVAVSSCGVYAASGSADNDVCIMAVSNGSCLRKLRGHQERVYSVAFAPTSTTTTSTWLASASGDKTIRIWDYTSDPVVYYVLTGHTNMVTSVSWSVDGSLFSISGQCGIRKWDPNQRLQTMAITSFSAWDPMSICNVLSSGGKFAAGYDDGTIQVWDEGHACIEEDARDPILQMVSSDLYHMIAVRTTGGIVHIVEGRTARTLLVLDGKRGDGRLPTNIRFEHIQDSAYLAVSFQGMTMAETVQLEDYIQVEGLVRSPSGAIDFYINDDGMLMHGTGNGIHTSLDPRICWIPEVRRWWKEGQQLMVVNGTTVALANSKGIITIIDCADFLKARILEVNQIQGGPSETSNDVKRAT
jgi:hypothetical protein